MPRRTLYSAEGVYVAPNAPTGQVISNRHILKRLHKITSVSHSVNFNYAEIQQLGKGPLVARSEIGGPNVNLSLNYYVDGIGNELKLGFNINYPSGNQNPYTEDRFNILSGFFETGRANDKRDIFIAIAPEGEDLYDDNTADPTDLTNESDIIDPQSPNYDIIQFQDCYVNNYSVGASIGQFPSVAVTLAASNIITYPNGSGIDIHTIDERNREIITTGINFVIPKFTRETGVYSSVVQPKDIQVQISGENIATNSMEDLIVNFNELRVQNFGISFDLNRTDLQSLGYKTVMDRKPNYPVLVDCSFSAFVGDYQTGTLFNILNEDRRYNVDIKMNGLVDCTDADPTTLVHYRLKRAKIDSITLANSVGSIGKIANFKFITQIVPEGFNEGLYISGVLTSGIMDGLMWESGIL